MKYLTTKSLRWMLVVAGLSLTGSDLHARGVLLGNPYFGFRASRRSAVGFLGSYHKRGLRISFGAYLNRSYFRRGYGFGSHFGPGFYPHVPRYAGYRHVSVAFYSAPPPPPPVVVLPAPVINVVNPPPAPLPLPPVQQPERPVPLPGQNRGKFRPIQPANRQRARQPGKVAEKPKPPEAFARKKAKGRRLLDPPVLPMPPQPRKKPEEESNRLVEKGRQAFAALEYGRAVRFFRRAAKAWPGNHRAHFLRAHALLTLDKYPEAVEAIHKGMQGKPDWPEATFRPITLYGAHVADYAAHLDLLQQTLERHPNDPVLLFLTAYQLWFDGRKEEARPLLLKAQDLLAAGGGKATGLVHPEVIQRFLQALPPGGVL